MDTCFRGRCILPRWRICRSKSRRTTIGGMDEQRLESACEVGSRAGAGDTSWYLGGLLLSCFHQHVLRNC